MCASQTLLVPAVLLHRAGKRKGRGCRCFQPSSSCFAMVGKFVLFSWLLMTRLVPCRSEPSLLWGIGPECWMKGGGEEIVGIVGLVREINELREQVQVPRFLFPRLAVAASLPLAASSLVTRPCCCPVSQGEGML